MKFKIIVSIVAFMVLFTTSCKKDFLAVSDELAGGLASVEEVFANPDYTKRWYGNVFTGIPDYSEMVRADWDGGGQTGLHNPWTGMTDEINTSYGDNFNYMISDRNSNNMRFHRWGPLYQLIRQANIFLENAVEIPASGVDANQITAAELKTMKANVVFVRAFYHYLLFEQYGPIPIVDRSYSPIEEIDLPRNTVDEVISFIDQELLSILNDLPQLPITDDNYKAMPTRGVAMAVRAKLWIHAASPLLNGGYPEALTLVDKKGTALFGSKDDSKWLKATEVLKEFITYSEGKYSLYKAYSNGQFDPELSFYELFQKYNDEVIWATATTGFNGIQWGDRYERRSTPRSEPNGIGSTAVLQELVDDFYMKDGLPIQNNSFLNASPLYSETGKSTLDGVEVSNMWIDREARFYNTVFFEGRRWHISNKPTYFHSGSANDRTGQHTPTGYLLYKRYNKRVHMRNPGVPLVFRPSIIFRLAEFYLLYAEALNETEPGNPDVLKYVNMVRERAGIPNLETLNPAIGGNQALQRAAIRRESRVELTTEGQRYFNVRRWMIAEAPASEGGQGGEFTGMNMAGDKDSFFQRTRFQTRIFNRKMYLYPIPLNEIQKSKVLIQNPGW